ncbi:DUF1858 domain-containing protein [Celeribacter indicus]|uniref:DUF1858 domain-containing protein n=1 Tax=Celeribacter indicus TaxID=1208324 RepID=A0A0B5DQ10_9RHOB|nr:DUF1858 domain-containing protein [Celeribacter indicus]AJE45633.1 hypothetical protein P73_0918 [Celeribacter indicus]SDW84086.1 hybrid cluster protein-associated redox disulfide domain-containing protein [Celeribacter indicus]
MPHDALTAPDLTLAELMARHPATVEVFLRHRMLCVGCLVSPFHTIDDACAEYRLGRETFTAALAAAITAARAPARRARDGADP